MRGSLAVVTRTTRVSSWRDVRARPPLRSAFGGAAAACRACRQARARLHQLAPRAQEHPPRRGARRPDRRFEDPGGRPRRRDRRSGQPVAARRIQARARLARRAWDTVRRHRHSRQSRHLCAGSLGRPIDVLGRLHARRQWRRSRRVPVRAPARQRGADRAVLGAADGSLPGDRAARREAARTLRRGARPHPRAFQDRAHSSSAGEFRRAAICAA